MSELKACPFCHSAPISRVYKRDDREIYVIMCLKCRVSTLKSEDIEIATEDWNNRHNLGLRIEGERMKKYKCRLCGKKVTYLRRGMCFDCNLMIAEEIAEAREHSCNEQEKINEGLFQLIQLQQDLLDELVKHIDNEVITQAIATRREIYKRCCGAAVRDAYRCWKEKL